MTRSPSSSQSSVRHRTADELSAAVSDITAAPIDAGSIELIVRRPAPSQREVLAEAVLDTDVGMVGDTWSSRRSSRTRDGSPHPGMQLTLMSTRVADAVAGGDRSAWPLAGDQLYVDLDLSEENLPAGTRLQVGTAIVEVSDVPHTGCAKFAERFGTDALRFVNTGPGRPGRWRGANARVVQGGRLVLGDVITRVQGSPGPT